MKETGAEALQRLVDSVHGLLCIVVSDRDGVELHRTFRTGGIVVELSAALLSTLALSAEQVGKLQLGEGTITSIYDNYVLVHSATGSFTVCLVGEPDTNVGRAVTVMPDVKAIFAESS